MDKYLKILGISYGLSLEEIKKKYKKLCMEYHPDRNAGFKEEATKKMKEINGAYEYIIDNFEIYRQHTSNNYEQYSNNQGNKGTTKCPYCDEEIKINAKKCKHCGEWLNDNIPDEREYENKTDDGFNSNRLSPGEKKIIIGLIIIIIFFIINKYTNLIKDKIRFWILSGLIISRFFEEYTEYESLNTSIPYWKWSLKKMLKSRLAIGMLIMLVAIGLCLIIY